MEVKPFPASIGRANPRSAAQLMPTAVASGHDNPVTIGLAALGPARSSFGVQTSVATEMPAPGKRLQSHAGVQRVPTPELELFIVRNFLDAPTCTALMEQIDHERRPSTIADDAGIERFRTSETCDLSSSDPIVAGVEAQICELLGLPPAHGEPLQGQRYAPGQEFRPHTDTFNPGGFDFYVHTANGGQRTWTAMIYLNEPEDGGATRFKAINKTVQPEAGKLLTWNNLDAHGRPNNWTLHQGMKVRRGTKYVLTKWFREQPWASGPA
jgi:prolyl 4-hydroxylase